MLEAVLGKTKICSFPSKKKEAWKERKALIFYVKTSFPSKLQLSVKGRKALHLPYESKLAAVWLFCERKLCQTKKASIVCERKKTSILLKEKRFLLIFCERKKTTLQVFPAVGTAFQIAKPIILTKHFMIVHESYENVNNDHICVISLEFVEWISECNGLWHLEHDAVHWSAVIFLAHLLRCELAAGISNSFKLFAETFAAFAFQFTFCCCCCCFSFYSQVFAFCEYLTVESQQDHHEEKENWPQWSNRHLGHSSRISNERQART